MSTLPSILCPLACIADALTIVISPKEVEYIVREQLSPSDSASTVSTSSDSRGALLRACLEVQRKFDVDPSAEMGNLVQFAMYEAKEADWEGCRAR